MTIKGCDDKLTRCVPRTPTQVVNPRLDIVSHDNLMRTSWSSLSCPKTSISTSRKNIIFWPYVIYTGRMVCNNIWVPWQRNNIQEDNYFRMWWENNQMCSTYTCTLSGILKLHKHIIYYYINTNHRFNDGKCNMYN